MSRFKDIDLKNILFLFTRKYWTVNSTGLLSYLYTFLYCCIYPLKSFIESFLAQRYHLYNLAGVPFTFLSATEFLNFYYDPIDYRIRFEYLNVINYVLLGAEVDDATNTPVFIGAEADDAYLYLPTERDGLIAANNLVVYVPASLQANVVLYQQFLADLNAICLDGIAYTVLTI